MKYAFLWGICFLAFLVACSNLNTCGENYFEYKKGDCCSDINQNKVCDQDENQEVFVAAKEEEIKKKDIDTLKEKLDEKSEEGVYKIVRDSLSGLCWIMMESDPYETHIQTIRPGEEPEEETEIYEWYQFPKDASCSKTQDCMDLLELLGMPEEQIQELTEPGMKCSENKP